MVSARASPCDWSWSPASATGSRLPFCGTLAIGRIASAPSPVNTPDVWQRFFDVNCLGPVRMTRAAIGPLRAGGWGRIVVNTTSYLTMLRVQPYGGVKAALESTAAVWANELSGSGVSVNVVVPGGPTDTPFVAEIGIEPAASPKTVFTDIVSNLSLSGVLVPWALM